MLRGRIRAELVKEKLFDKAHKLDQAKSKPGLSAEQPPAQVAGGSMTFCIFC